MKCSKCGRSVRSDRTNEICRQCASVCECGKPKDFRAARCCSCSNKEKCEAQWAREDVRAKMLKSIRASSKKRRTTFADLTIESFNMTKKDGRKFAHYWEGDRHRYIYRYQWVWLNAGRKIPKGHHVHHLNGDCTDDRLENLATISPSDHSRLHATPEKQMKASAARGARYLGGKLTFVCEVCGEEFKSYERAVGVPRRFCSMTCKRMAMRKAA